jgi:hypothetical protein
VVRRSAPAGCHPIRKSVRSGAFALEAPLMTWLHRAFDVIGFFSICYVLVSVVGALVQWREFRRAVRDESSIHLLSDSDELRRFKARHR